MSKLTITLPQTEKERLARIALSYGLSLPEFSRYVLSELNSDIPEESLNDYEHPRKLKASIEQALMDWQKHKGFSKL